MNSFDESKVGFHLSQEHIITIGQLVENFEEENKGNKWENILIPKTD